MTPPVRPYEPGDIRLVFSSWQLQARAVRPCKNMRGPEWEAHKRLIKALIRRCPPQLEHEPGFPAQVHGWICGEVRDGLQVLHMVYTRNYWREKGCAGRLMAHMFPDMGSEPVYHTHNTAATHFHRKRWGLRFNPYLVGTHGRQEDSAEDSAEDSRRDRVDRPHSPHGRPGDNGGRPQPPA